MPQMSPLSWLLLFLFFTLIFFIYNSLNFFIFNYNIKNNKLKKSKLLYYWKW